MYIYKRFFVYFHLCSDIGPNMFLFFFCIGDFLYSGCFFFLLNYCGDSKLLEKTLPCTEHASNFDQGHILNLDLG